MRLPLLLLALAAGGAAAQSGTLTFSERDLDNETRQIVGTSATVDINSAVSIQIDKAALRVVVAKVNPELPAREIDTVRRIQGLVAQGLAALPEMRQALADWGDPAKRATAAAAIARVAKAAQPVLQEAVQGIPELDADINRRLE